MGSGRLEEPAGVRQILVADALRVADDLFSGVDGEGLLILLDESGVCCSPGSACSTGSVEPSRVIKAMGFSSERARSSVRFSFSLFNTEGEVDQAIEILKTAVEKLRVVIPRGGGRVVVNT